MYDYSILNKNLKLKKGIIKFNLDFTEIVQFSNQKELKFLILCSAMAIIIICVFCEYWWYLKEKRE
jgi:2-hydroxy-3-keto-5-methylthiopentenyl-1-phosphate phosphatase